ncbi:MAG: four helix bundle protein [Saprospiraceae bacterium]
MTIKRFEELIIWQLGRELAKDIYELTKADCWNEDFNFRGQIWRSSGSVPDNIAEGFEREGNKEFKQFLSIAKGSCGECRTQIYRAYDRGYISKEQFDFLVEKTVVLGTKIHNTMAAISQADSKGNKFRG